MAKPPKQTATPGSDGPSAPPVVQIETADASTTQDVAPIGPTPPDADAAVAPLADGDGIRMLVGQEGPGLSRVPGQALTIGTDLDAPEAQRLIDAMFAERA